VWFRLTHGLLVAIVEKIGYRIEHQQLTYSFLEVIAINFCCAQLLQGQRYKFLNARRTKEVVMREQSSCLPNTLTVTGGMGTPFKVVVLSPMLLSVHYFYFLISII
jgi:hypothetical protein